MCEIKFTINIIPTAQMRARHFAKKTKTGKMFSGTYKHPDQDRNEEQLMQILERYRPEKPLAGPVILGVTAYLPIPQSKSDWWKEAAEKQHIFPITKPDLDNLIKNIKDCMTQLCFWNDDSQVIGYDRPVKFYSINPRWEITLREVWQPRTKKEYMEKIGTGLTLDVVLNQMELKI